MDGVNRKFLLGAFVLLLSIFPMACSRASAPGGSGFSSGSGNGDGGSTGNNTGGGNIEGHTGGGPLRIYPWEKYPEIDHSWVKPEFQAQVKAFGGESAHLDFTYPSDDTQNPLIFAPKSGQFDFLGVNLSSDPSTFQVNFNFDKSHIDTTGHFEAYSYVNSQLSYTDTAYAYAYPYWTTRLFGKTDHKSVGVGDVWKVLYIFKGKDGHTYKYTSPVMEARNA